MKVGEAELELPQACSSAFVLGLPALLPPSFSLSGPYPYLWAAHEQVRAQRNLKNPASLSFVEVLHRPGSLFTFLRASLSSSGMLAVLLWLFGTQSLSCSVEKFIFGWCWLALFVALRSLTAPATACQMSPHTHTLATHTANLLAFHPHLPQWHLQELLKCVV